MAVDLTNVEKLSERQLATERQLSELAAAFKALEARVAEFARPAALAAAAPAVAAPAAASQGKGNVTPDILVVIAAAVTAFLGKKVRIRSAKMLQSPYELVNPWSQQGRVFVQASHNLR